MQKQYQKIQNTKIKKNIDRACFFTGISSGVRGVGLGAGFDCRSILHLWSFKLPKGTKRSAFGSLWLLCAPSPGLCDPLANAKCAVGRGFTTQ